MGGRIDFVSEPGRGSTFRFTLSTEAPADTEPNSARHRAQLAESNAKVLVCVEQEKRRRTLARLFISWGFEVELANSVPELVTKLDHDGPRTTLTVLEHRPEHIDLGLLRRLRQPPHRELLLLTSLGASTSTVLTETCPHLVVKPIRQTKLAEAAARALGLRTQTLAAASEAVPVPAPIENTRYTILLVEDNPDNQKLAERVLEGAGMIVDTAVNGQEAVEMAGHTLYDLIVMDLMMPVMDGFQATEEIRNQETAPNRVPIVALTAHATEGFRDRCLQSGMDDYLSKPFKKERFLAVVEQWVDRRPIILVADDAPENRLIVKRFLMIGGDYRLLFATNGEEAVELFVRQGVSLILLDMEMPIRDGFEAARTIRGLPDGDGVPIIAMTAHTDTKELARCTAAGCTTVIQKPLERTKLNTLVVKHLKRRVADLSEDIEAATRTEPEEAPAGVVLIDPDIQDLVPRFLENQQSNAQLVLDLCATGDFETIRRIGHNMKGTGKGYGFEVISSSGASLEQAASKVQARDVERIARELSTYLSEIRWQPRG